MAKKPFNRTRPDSGQRNRKKTPRVPKSPVPATIQDAKKQMTEAGDKAAVQAHVDETRAVTAVQLVAEDNDKFPARTTDSHPPQAGAGPEGSQGDQGAPAASATNPPGRPRGRKPGSKDSYSRGRPARPDWPNEPITPLKKPDQGAGPGPIPQPVKEANAQIAPPDYRPLATVMVDMGMGACIQFLGPQWAPKNIGGFDEREQIIGALTKYLEANHITDIPPGAMLAIMLGGYGIPRLVDQIRRYLKNKQPVTTLSRRPSGPAQEKKTPEEKPVHANGSEQPVTSPAGEGDRNIGASNEEKLNG